LSNQRVRISGKLTRARRGLLLTAEDGAVWVVDTDELDETLVDNSVTVDGTTSGVDRLKADWIGQPV
jgi:hypothetical protein